jgi:hypothetical protein
LDAAALITSAEITWPQAGYKITRRRRCDSITQARAGRGGSSFAIFDLYIGLCGLQMCQLCGGRISKYFVRWGKNKKHSVGQRVGLEAVLLQYGLYVFGHLSKWFVFVLMFKFQVGQSSLERSSYHWL